MTKEIPRAALLGDTCNGHDCFPSRDNDEGSPNVIINGIPHHRQGDHWAEHCCTCPWTPHGCHDSALASGSSTVYTNGKQSGRKGDPVACGSSVAGPCSPDVIIGG